MSVSAWASSLNGVEPRSAYRTALAKRKRTQTKHEWKTIEAGATPCPRELRKARIHSPSGQRRGVLGVFVQYNCRNHDDKIARLQQIPGRISGKSRSGTRSSSPGANVSRGHSVEAVLWHRPGAEPGAPAPGGAESQSRPLLAERDSPQGFRLERRAALPANLPTGVGTIARRPSRGRFTICRRARRGAASFPSSW